MSDKPSKSLEERVDAIESKIDSILEALKSASEIRKNNGSIIDNNFVLLNEKINKLSEVVKTLHSDTNQNFEEVKFELIKIQKTTDYDIFYENLKIVGDVKE